MKRLHRPVEKRTRPTRREFLLAGGAVVTTLSLGAAPGSGPAKASEKREKIREIMEQYGSELGHARYIERE